MTKSASKSSLAIFLLIASAALIGRVMSVKDEVASQARTDEPVAVQSGPQQTSPGTVTALALEAKPSENGVATAPQQVFQVVGKTTGQPLVPGSAAFVQEILAGRKPLGRVTHLDPRSLDRTMSDLQPGDAISIPLTDQESIPATVKFVATPAEGVLSVIGSLVGREGSFSFERESGKVRGTVMLLKEGLAYRIDQDGTGGVALQEVTLGEVICLPPGQAVEKASKLAAPGEEPAASEPVAPPPSEVAPILNSRPSAVIQFYLNFDGDTVAGTSWNTTYNNGDPIVAAAAGLTAAQITTVFNEVAEHFRPFNVNITTDPARYNAAAATQRMRCIVTPTNTAGGGAPGTLGIAFLNTFGVTSVNSVCWGFTHDVASYGIVSIAGCIAHELGHTLSLTHDGVAPDPDFATYFKGHGQGVVQMSPPGFSNTFSYSWGPIMGSPFRSVAYDLGGGTTSYVRTRADVVQWSKGEYTTANNFQDDVAIIGGKLGFVPDEDGGTRATTAYLSVTGTTASHPGVISSETDVDFFSFNTTGGMVSIQGSATTDNPLPDLDMVLQLLDSTGAVVASNNPANSMLASLSASCPAGTYFVKVSGAGSGDPAADGYSSYSSIGAYTLQGSIAGYVPSPPVVTSATSIATSTTATLGGNVISSGSASITARGVVYALTSVNASPQLGGAGTTNLVDAATTTGVFTVAASGLIPNTGYSFSAYAISSAGTTYTSPASTFTTPALSGASALTDSSLADFQGGATTDLDTATTPGAIILPPGVDQQNATVTGSGFTFSATSWVGQTFTPSITGTVPRIDLDLFASGVTGTTPDITVSIRATTGSPAVPTGADLATATITGFSSGSSAYYTALFASPATLTAGTTYAVVVRATANPSAGSYAYVGSFSAPDSNPYASGQRVTSGSSGASWAADTTSGGRDLGFKIYTGYTPAGSFTSAVKDSGASAVWTSLVWTAATPALTSVKFQVAASTSSSGPFTFVGPDGTASSYFTYSGISLRQFNGLRYLKYRAFLASTDPAVTATLQDVTVNYGVLTTPAVPTVTTPAATAISTTTVTLGGTVTSDGNVPLTARGVVYALTSANANPQMGGSGVTTVVDAAAKPGVFTESIAGLTRGTAYSFAAYATNSLGTSYTSPVSTFTTAQSNDASLAALSPSTGSFTFAPSTYAYSLSVLNTVASITVTPTVTDVGATVQVQVNGAGYSGVTSGVASGALSLNVGSNAISVKVTAQDGVTTQIYTVTVLRGSALATFTDTTQSNFTAGVATNLDLTTTSGAAILATAIDQQNTTYTTSGFGFNTTNWAGQTFTPTVTGTVPRIDLVLFASGVTGTTPDITVSIRATTGTPAIPTGPDLATATITGFNGGSAVSYPALFATPATLTAGTRYAVIFRPTANPSAGTYAYVGSFTSPDSNPYANGQWITSGNAGTSWTADTTVGGRDLGFKIYQGYQASGDLVSSVIDSNPVSGLSPIWTSLNWTATTPASTAIKFQAAASNSAAGPFNFVGPDGTAATYFTYSGVSLRQFNGLRYLKYRAYLSSSDASVTPVLQDVSVNFNVLIPATVPALTSPSIANVTTSAVTLGGNLTSDGDAPILARGIVYSITSTNASPHLGGSGVTVVTDAAALPGVFTESLGGLTAGVSYTFAAYATNSAGTGYTSATLFGVGSSNVDLSALALTTATLSPGFDSTIIAYTATVPNTTAAVTVTASTAQAGATLKVNNATVVSGTASGSIPLNVGANTITVLVTAENGLFNRPYTITVTRQTAFATWAIANSLPTDPTAGGGVNFMRFAFGLSPSGSDNGVVVIDGSGGLVSVGSPTVNVQKDGGTFSYKALFSRRKDWAAAGLSYSVQFSGDLTTWTASSETPATIASDASNEAVTVRYPFFVNGMKAQFFRVVVSLTP